MLHHQLEYLLAKLDDTGILIFGLSYLESRRDLSNPLLDEFRIDVRPYLDFAVFICSGCRDNTGLVTQEKIQKLSDVFATIYIDSEQYTGISTLYANNLLAISQAVLAGFGRGNLTSKERAVIETYPIDIEWAKISSRNGEIRYPDDQDPEFKAKIEQDASYREAIEGLKELAADAQNLSSTTRS